MSKQEEPLRSQAGSDSILQPEAPWRCLKFHNREFPDDQLQILWQCRHTSGEDTRFERGEIEQSLPSRFQQQVARYPDRLAVKSHSASLTYAELNEAANRVAWKLMSRVPNVTRVGLYLNHGMSSVIGYLGVMKAGKISVFLDRAGPAERTKAIVEAAGLGCVVSNECDFESLREFGFGAGSMIATDDCDQYPATNPEVEIGPAALADITYSSGSTGRPKGIVHTHRNRLHNAWSLSNTFQICPYDRITQLHSVTSGPAPTDIHLALLNGAALCSFDLNHQDVSTLAAWLADDEITVVHWVPSLFRLFGTTLRAEDRFSSVRLVILGSEQATTHDHEIVKRHFSETCGFVHRLGSIETLNTRLYVADRRTELPTGGMPAGYPLPDKKAFLIDETGQPVPDGETGEVVISSEWLAIEYDGQLESTTASFFINPKDGARCFRTGDLGRLGPDGCLTYLGRANRRMKLHGKWVDIARIETLFMEQTQIADCAVVIREDERSGSRLTAFLVPAEGAVLNVSELRASLSRSISLDQVPSRFLSVFRLPRLASGKLNQQLLSRTALAELTVHCGSVEELRESGTFVAPASELEKSLAEIWEDVFDVRPLGVHDSFFDLGGDSLLAMRLAIRVNQAFDCELSPTSLFSAPTIAQFATFLASAATNRTAESATTAIIPRKSQQPTPLSFGQQRLWFLEQMEAELTAYNMPQVWRLRGELHLEALRRALQEIVQRHAPLRTTFAILEGEPVQVVRKIDRLELPLIDLAGLATALQDTEVMQRCAAEADRPFDLTCDLMLRAAVLRMGKHDHRLLLTLHHIASDGWSLRILWRELAVVYDAYCRQAIGNLPDLPIDYGDYSVWQRRQSQGSRLAGLLHYWREQLANLTVLELPTDRPRPPLPSYRGARHDFQLPPELMHELQSLSRIEGATLHMTLLAAFQLLLKRYSGQDDIVVGTPIAGRNNAALEGLIGFFVNTLVLRTDLSGDPTFRELLGRVRQVSLAAYDHQDLPFEKLVEELQPERHLSRSPLVQVLFQLLSFPDQELCLKGLEVSRLPQSTGRVKFDLEMSLWQPTDRTEACQGSVEYSTELFDPATIASFTRHYLTLLENLVANRDQRISRLALLTPQDRHQLLVAWNDTDREYPREKCVHQLFEEQVERTPAAIAVIDQDRRWTYRELNEQADRLAGRLEAFGLNHGGTVAVCLDRSVELVAALLGIWKAGAAYLPLDPLYPTERLAFMVQDSGASVLLTQESLRTTVVHDSLRTLILEQEQPESVSASPAASAHRAVTSDSLAYILYTSGSTGRPKGVEISHQNLGNFLDSMKREPGLHSDDRVLAITTISFDIHALEFWLPLIVGASVVIADRATAIDGTALSQLLDSSAATVLQATPATWRLLLAAGWTGRSSLKALCGGEAFPDDLRQPLREKVGQLWNMYGPTETTVWSTVWRMETDQTPTLIGKPIGNTRVYVMDSHDQLAPVGAPGELWIGGDGVAQGYRGRPDLTAERFVPDPFRTGGHRAYRTGDLARWKADGSLELLGRIDHQVKLRGYRIELGEIEAAIIQHPSVAQAVVLLRDEDPGDSRLVAYCVSVENAALDIAGILRELRVRLPDYMIPAAFVPLAEIPLTPNGKVNRRALPAPSDARPELDREFIAPRNRLEVLLASAWCEFLKIDRIGIHENFFNLGGHSLLAIRIISRLSESLQRPVPVAMFFRHPTIAAMAEALAKPIAAAGVGAVTELRSGNEDAPLFLFPPLGATILSLRELVESLPTNRRVLAVDWHAGRTPGQNHPSDDLGRDCANQIKGFQPVGPYLLVGYSFGGRLAFETACRLLDAGERVSFLAIIDAGPGKISQWTWQERLLGIGRCLENAPRWLTQDLFAESAASLFGRVWRKLNQLSRRFQFQSTANESDSGTRIEDLFESNQFPSWLQQRIKLDLLAADRFQHTSYPVKVTLFRSKVRPLLKGHLVDLAWMRVARHGVEVHDVPGHHGTMMRQPYVQNMAKCLAEAIETSPA